jgi:integral membrane protein (TIGR01906 family)
MMLARRVPLRFVRFLLGTAAALLVPVVIFLSVVHQLTADRQFYLWGYDTFQVSASTGMSRQQLEEATDQLLDFFSGGPPVSIRIIKGGQPAPLYNEKELKHLDDVRHLMNTAWLVQQMSLAALLVLAALSLVLGRVAGLRWLSKIAVAGGIVTIGSILLMGFLAVLDFRAFWTQFHILSFSNDLWLLDPRTDYLIRMFPPAFWFQAVMLVALRSALAGAVLLAAGLFMLWVTREWQPKTGQGPGQART